MTRPTPGEILAQGEQPDELIWALCPYIQGRGHRECVRCPEWEESHHGNVQRGCRALASEACQVVRAMLARQDEQRVV